VQVLRRLSGIKTETSAVFNMATQFGGGKTHALTLLYHLATHGAEAHTWKDVRKLVAKAGVATVPQAKAAVLVGTEFDSITGRGGTDGTPIRKTPWGEIAWQLGGKAALAKVAEHEERFVEPKGDVIRSFLPKNKPCLILMDEILSYVSTYRKAGYQNSLYNFIESLSETARGQDNVVLVVSIPSSVISYTDADETDQQRFKHMLDRVGKAAIMSAEAETAEIIRRRLFDWGGLPSEARKVAAGARRDTVIGLGTAPLDDPMFRAAMFEQLGEPRLEGAVTTDICGKRGAHAVRLDEEAVDTIKKARLHRKVSTVIFFESNGGQVKAEATLPEIRLGVSEPDLEIGNVETALEALGNSCYFLTAERNRYRFGLMPNLNKLLADRRANIQAERIDDRVKAEIGKAFPTSQGVDVRLFPERSNQLPDRPVLTLVVMAPQDAVSNPATMETIETLTREHGRSARTFKSALIFSVAADGAPLREEARKVLAWEDIRDEDEDRLDERQQRQLRENLKRAQRDLAECVWRSYNHVVILGKDNQIEDKDLGLVHSSQTDNMVKLIIDSLKQEDIVTAGVSPNVLKKHWTGAAVEWSTKAVRDAFFASPQFPRLLDGEVIKDTIAKGVASRILGYVGKGKGGRYEPFHFGEALSEADIEISDEMFIIPAEEAAKHIEPPTLTSVRMTPDSVYVKPGVKQTFTAKTLDEKEPEPKPKKAGTLSWTGEVPSQKWMNFYRKVLTDYAQEKSLRLSVSFDVQPKDGLTDQAVDKTKIALRELGLNDDVQAQ